MVFLVERQAPCKVKDVCIRHALTQIVYGTSAEEIILKRCRGNKIYDCESYNIIKKGAVSA